MDTNNKSCHFGWPQAFTVVSSFALAVIAFIAFTYFQKKQTVFSEHENTQVSQAFVDYIQATYPEDRTLNVASIDTIEHFVKARPQAAPNGWTHLAEDREEIRIPATYTYYVHGDHSWSFEINGNTCIVSAPAIYIRKPITVHSDQIASKDGDTWMPIQDESLQTTLLESLIPTLHQRAEESIAEATPVAREALIAIINQWLIEKKYIKDSKFSTVIVDFAPSPEKQLEIPTEALPLEKVETPAEEAIISEPEEALTTEEATEVEAPTSDEPLPAA